MFRVIAIICGGLALAACSTSPDWLKFGSSTPATESVRFESEPPGAEAKLSNGQACRTPCALALPAGSYAVTFTLNGYEPASDKIEMTTVGENTQALQPNPVLAELTPAPPPPAPPAAKKPSRKKPIAAKPAPKTAARATNMNASAPQAMEPVPTQQAPSPWPSAPR